MKTCPTCSAGYPDSVAFCPRDGAALRSTAGLEPGTIIRKKYQVVDEIARGGMGIVYRVRHLLWNEDKAIKVLLDVGGRSQRPEGFLAEALVMRQIEHPNVVRVEDADFTEDDQLFVVMEFVQGESLAERISRGPLPWKQALEFTAQACAGLAAAHHKGIVHRDIKPQNLLVTKDASGCEIVKVIDFGIAKVREDAGIGVDSPTSTLTNVFVGTPEYASPEQAQGARGNELDARSDLYSLGLVLYEMLTGARPFPANTTVASLLLRLQDEPVPPNRVKPELGISQKVSDIVMKALAKDKDGRFASADEMGQAIESALERTAAATTAPTVQLALTPKTKKRSVVWVAAALGVIAAAAAGIYAVTSRPHQAASLTSSLPPDADATATAAPPAPPPETPKVAIAEKKKPQEPPQVSTKPAPKQVPAAATVPEPQNNAPRLKVNPQDGLDYVWIPPGSFTMGCSVGDSACTDDESPPRSVTLSKGFWIGKIEVTQAAYQRVMAQNPSDFKGDDLPVDSVNWFQANRYCKAAGMRLPTEAEWEYAARAGTSGSRYGSFSEIAWWSGNSDSKSHPGGQKQPNAFGLFDMIGNLAEWTADWYAPYTADPTTDPRGPAEGQQRVSRGGSWFTGIIVARASKRIPRLPGARSHFTGFRCVGD